MLEKINYSVSFKALSASIYGAIMYSVYINIERN